MSEKFVETKTIGDLERALDIRFGSIAREAMRQGDIAAAKRALAEYERDSGIALADLKQELGIA